MALLHDKGSALSWDMADEIRRHIFDPAFPDYAVDITAFGAVPDSGQLDTRAVQDAIDHVSAKGGGTVVVPAGAFTVGALRLKSNVNLHLADAGSTLLFTKDINERNYPVVYSHWEATPCYNYSALVYAKDAENIALTGKGVLDAQSDYDNVWWNWRKESPADDGGADELQAAGQEKTREQNDNGVPVRERVFGDGWYLRPNFIQTINCKNVLLEGVTLLNSPMWQVNPVLCENVTVRGMTLRAHGYNTDCVDPESCNYVLIENNVFDSGDDCIAIKSGRDRDGREINAPCRNVLIFNNEMKDGHGGIALGSEMSGGICNVFADGNHFDSPELTYPLRLKTNAKRGGVIENVYLRNSVIANVDQAVIHGTMLYAEGAIGDFTPVFRNITIENVKAQNGLYGIFIEAFKDSPVSGLTLRNIAIDGVRHPIRAMNWADDVVMDNVVINGRPYPSPTEARMLGVPRPGATVTGAALLIGGDASTLSYAWELSDRDDGGWRKAGDGAVFAVPDDAGGTFVRVTAADPAGRAAASIAYRVLSRDANLDAAAARLATRGVIDADFAMDPDREITRIELARMLARLWRLGAPKKRPQFTDIDAASPDFAVAAAVVEEGMMGLDRSLNVNRTDVQNKLAAGDAKNFEPSRPVSREEMGTIAMMSCGVSYKNACNTYDTTYKDGRQISSANLTDVERGSTLGFWDRGDGYFRPKANMTWGMTLDVLNRVADFAGV